MLYREFYRFDKGKSLHFLLQSCEKLEIFEIKRATRVSRQQYHAIILNKQLYRCLRFRYNTSHYAAIDLQ